MGSEGTMSALGWIVLADRDHVELRNRRQCVLVGMARSVVYRQPQPIDDGDLGLMCSRDKLFLAWLFLGCC